MPLHQVRAASKCKNPQRATIEAVLVFDEDIIFVSCSVLSGYGRNSLDNELDMELDDDDEEEMDGFTEDRLDPPRVVSCLDKIIDSHI